jgi:hypothetical protein
MEEQMGPIVQALGFTYYKKKLLGSVVRVRWHLIGMGKKEKVIACVHAPETEKSTLVKWYLEVEKIKKVDEGSFQPNNNPNG